ncbi:MBL fold metallo-hydrolase [Mycolicibacterium peregrinum]|uniref:MBL fold metallo-hydrolase n=1 Tax=Mycolicibacterium peregrinum TaxID=43304 RepID=UPI0006D7D090|nr:MBL fold metallo-hydrolase [Mycolicibacterium peregrinum]MCV7203347.1 MBL fold metallo-hydrolase [Mycolicibacterium peregrinum]ORW53625.1 MBL fold metallo-hydrolase [Mycolicibacterium peregrinum]
MNEIALGDVTVTRVTEYYGSVRLSPQEFFPESTDDMWRRNEDWLAPDFYDPGHDDCVSAIQTWVLRSEGRTILVDTGVGNHKERPHAPVWHRLDTDFLGNLARAGVAPEDVDVVINTHLHIDHVGWNTYLDDGNWIPTFPNATYLMPRADFDFFNPANRNGPVVGRDNVFLDSVAPVHKAGQATLWENGFRIDGNLTLEPAPGHTPGSAVVRLQSGGDRAVFVGDMMHTALQIAEPDVNSCYCEDREQARASRRRVLGHAADTNTLVIPAHFGGHGAAEVMRDGDRFAVKEWAGFERVTA